MPDNHFFQFVEDEYMLAEEYDHFFENPGEYLLRTVLPSIAGNLEGLAKLPPFYTVVSGYVRPRCCRHSQIRRWPKRWRRSS